MFLVGAGCILCSPVNNASWDAIFGADLPIKWRVNFAKIYFSLLYIVKEKSLYLEKNHLLKKMPKKSEEEVLQIILELQMEIVFSLGHSLSINKKHNYWIVHYVYFNTAEKCCHMYNQSWCH